ncbi:MAG: hypothetical protein AB9M60_00375 [Leptothrix sp. (in: b-proteobacteria)]
MTDRDASAMRQDRPRCNTTLTAPNRLTLELLADLLIDTGHQQHAKALRAGAAGAEEAEALARKLASTPGPHRSAWLRWSGPLAHITDRPAVRLLVETLTTPNRIKDGSIVAVSKDDQR